MNYNAFSHPELTGVAMSLERKKWWQPPQTCIVVGGGLPIRSNIDYVDH